MLKHYTFRELITRNESDYAREERYISPATFLGYETLDSRYVKQFTSALQKINRLPTAYLANDLLKQFHKTATNEPDTYDDFYSTTIDEIEVLGEIQKNRHISSALGCWNGQNQVNVTLIADGTGKFDVNGISLNDFFRRSPDHIMKALSPLERG